MRCDVVIVSYKPDLCWLEYCLRLLRKNWLENSAIIVRLPLDCRETVAGWKIPDVRLRYVTPWPDGYSHAMYQKMLSDDYTDAELVMLVDSDVMLVSPADRHDLMPNAKPVVYFRRWGENGEQVAEQVWRRPTSRVMGMDLDRDYMVSAPQLFWGETFRLARNRIVTTTGCGFKEAVYSDVPFFSTNFTRHPMTFCDLESLALSAITFEPQRYEFRHLSQRPNFWPFRQYWSHGGLDAKIKEELDKALAQS